MLALIVLVRAGSVKTVAAQFAEVHDLRVEFGDFLPMGVTIVVVVVVNSN